MAAEATAARRRRKDMERAAELKRAKVERRTGKCCICYRVIGNDTHGGNEVWHHYLRHAFGQR